MKKLTYLILFLLAFNGLKAQIVNIPDVKFKSFLVSATYNVQIAVNEYGSNMTIDKNSDGEIQVTEAEQVYELYIVYGKGIESLDGINSFSNLRKIYVVNEPLNGLNLNGLLYLENLSARQCALTNFNIINCPNLINVDFEYNQFATLDFSTLLQLVYVSCGYNNLTSLNVNGLTNLYSMSCESNQLTNLNLQGLNGLTSVDCSYNQLTNLNLNGLQNLSMLTCINNLLETISLEGCSSLGNAYCANNSLKFIDLNQCTALQFIDLHDNPTLTSVFSKNGAYESIGSNLNINNNLGNNVVYACCDAFEVDVRSQTFPRAEVNTYCSFVPGGNYFVINGNNKFDGDNNGCSGSDLNFTNLKLKFTDGSTANTLIPDGTGFYSIPVGTGAFVITPILENPTYFNASPTTATVTFPTQGSPFTQGFCITANGIHPDLEITILPIVRARPGFDVTYKIIYKNKGNQLQSGSVNLNFNDSVLDFVSSIPAISNQAVNTLTWDFLNLAPFESREITLIVNVNSPMETPAVNSGDILSYTATITSGTTDETPNDNTITFNQTVVNSLDPNDKTCVEGTTITPSMVGEYVHYVINFENTGTFPAQNIVVKDIIDTAKFDISTLVPIKGSAEFITKISDTNKVEFIFENINLPNDDGNNDGFVAFKIKTKSTLVLGNIFSNSANIYFDYNFPIITNTATTTVQTLGTTDFDFDTYFKVYPNPASSNLNLATQSGISVNSIAIYNTLGQLVIAIPNAQTVSTIDVSSLKTGNYFIKVGTDKGTSNTKFIKN